jgi:nitronate monooxygenase
MPARYRRSPSWRRPGSGSTGRSRCRARSATASTAEDIVYSNLFTGVHGNYLKPSIVAAGMDPDNLPESDASKMSFGTDASGERAKPKAWKEIWGSGQGVGSVGKILPAAELIARFKKEYDDAVDPAL